MNIAEVKEMLALVNASDLTEFDLQIDNVVLHMSKNTNSANVNQQVATPSSEVTVAQSANQTVRSQPSTITEAEIAEEVITEKEGSLVRAPIVGVVYLAASPDKPDFKKVGDTVEIGETLCIVEAMKLMNEITSDVAGTIAEILIENEQVVEYNQPLYRIV
ncbi:acetyl-CoA carboxylase biotin carboxyl carrier protein [Carnobacterium gallinarum]|uniref:acetyl-CoA carboxylase biotin carboxyl carrier protein n=1 Tax=Carnobacterium gallinarum TaxID=2749 RepID=UPI00054CF700|nr:acetyl-CoA carboxylase biotin carboxyl carrier protein [Carnobacterium gallinarum]